MSVHETIDQAFEQLELSTKHVIKEARQRDWSELAEQQIETLGLVILLRKRVADELAAKEVHDNVLIGAAETMRRVLG